MTVTDAPQTAGSADYLDELRTFLAENWDPDATVAEWWERMGLAGWAAPQLPLNAYGRNLSRGDAVRVQEEIAAFGALGAPGGLGLLLAAPTIASHGTQEQIDLYVRDIVTGRKAWCQLFSEPGAGSDLAGLTCKAERDGDEYIVTGQKVWTSYGHIADLGMLIARTNPDAPKHQGISYFGIDMDQPGIEIRPLREITGHAMFNEVFLTEARVGADAVIGGLNSGWAVANTTLVNERAGLGSGGGSAASGAATPGGIAGHLSLRAGDFVRAPQKTTATPKRTASAGRLSGSTKMLADLAAGNGAIADPTVRQQLMKLHTLGELGRYNNLRLKAVRASGGDIAGMANLAKLSMSEMLRVQRDLGPQIVGPSAMLHAYRDEDRAAITDATGNPFLAMVTGTCLYAPAPSIYGGTDQVQRNIVGERVLGLPKEPGTDNSVPFSSLPRNA